MPRQTLFPPSPTDRAAHPPAAPSIFGRVPAPATAALSGLLAGQTILLVEDSRAAADTLRLMCQRLGARLRRADCVEAARRHLALYRPDAVLVDLGLPDAPGEDLIAEIAAMPQRPAAVIGLSGLIEGREAALAAGADGFLEKPLPGAVALAQMLLPLLGDGPSRADARLDALARHPDAEAAIFAGARPDPMALRDDLMLADHLLRLPHLAQGPGYVLGFLRGLGRISGDAGMVRGALDVAQGRAELAALAALVQDRLKRMEPEAPVIAP